MPRRGMVIVFLVLLVPTAEQLGARAARAFAAVGR